MSQKIFTFSVCEDDTDKLKLMNQIKDECKKSGQTFTHVCLVALKEWKERKDENQR